MKTDANNRFQGTLHKVSGPLNRDVGHKKMKDALIILLLMIMAGCTSDRNPSPQHSDITTNRIYSDITIGAVVNTNHYGEEIWDGERLIEFRVISDDMVIQRTTYTNERHGTIDAIREIREDNGLMSTLSVTRVEASTLLKPYRPETSEWK